MRALLDEFQSDGRYVFTKREVVDLRGYTESSFKMAAHRAQKKGLIAQVKQGFFVIVPPEYRSVGCLPPSWFISDLMRYLGAPYYVGLLTAASLYGAAHQQPQVFQVMTNKRVSSIKLGRVHIDFTYKKEWPELWSSPMKTSTGRMLVSTVEATAIDLTRFIAQAGYIDNVAILINELAESMDAVKIRVLLDSQLCQKASIQRLGYLLERYGYQKLSSVIHEWLSKQQLNYAPLLPGGELSDIEKNSKWRIDINHQIDEDI